MRHDGPGLPRFRRPAFVGALVLVLTLALTACSGHSPSTTATGGTKAREAESLWWLLLWASVGVCVIVFVGLTWPLIRRRRASTKVHRTNAIRLVAVTGALVPFVALTLVYAVGLHYTSEMAQPSSDPTVTIDVVAHDWWWEVRYDGQDIVTANEVHVPVGSPVKMRFRTDDVLHSFWVPQLMPKVDVIAGKTNQTWLQADKPGRYRGACAEYCGLQHAHMAFVVVAEKQSTFDAWMADASGPAPTPDAAAEQHGMEVFEQSACASCHTIRGTTADGTIGPDLTNFGSRWSIGAGTLPNDRAHLADWITNPQVSKSGSDMPPQQVSPQDLQDLITYLESLK